MIAVKNEFLFLSVIDAASAHAHAVARFDAQQYECTQAQANALYSASTRYTARIAAAQQLDEIDAQRERACARSIYRSDIAQALDLHAHTISI